MTVNDLTVRGSTNTENTLLLNYFGTVLPLTVLNGLTLQDDGRILNLSSGLVVQSGTVVVTNSQMIQDGGLVRATNTEMHLSYAEYDLTNGVFEAGTVRVGWPFSSTFNQFGGTVVITNLVLGPGNPGDVPPGSCVSGYALYGGNLSLPGGLTLLDPNNTVNSYLQEGGTNQTTKVYIEPDIFGNSPYFTLNGGLLADNEVNLVGDDFAGVTLQQNGGTHIVSNSLNISGGAANGYTPLQSTYQLNGGALSASNINLNGNPGPAAFTQTNGITQAGQINANGYWFTAPTSTYVTLSGGTLACSNLFSSDGGYINQSGGVLIVSNLLSFGGYRVPEGPPPIYTQYTFTDGTLVASNINVGGQWFIGSASLPNRISNRGTCSLALMLVISNAVEQLGRFILATNATIDLAGNASRLSFADSSGQTWSGSAILTILNWNGNPQGGGAEQLKFGTDQSGLTPAQLAQMQFQLGSPPQRYSAKILNTGEVVPDRVLGASVAYAKQGNNLVLTWPSGWSLQTATNASGPYSDVSGATSPYTNNISLHAQRFFRLRQ